MRLTDIFLFEDQDLQEIDMSPGGLQRQAANINATVGIEFEMIVPGVKGDNEYAEPERDYGHNPRTRSISDIEEFFYDGDYNSRRDVARLVDNLTERYNEWQEEQFQDRWEVDKTEMIYEYVRYELDDDIIAELLGFNADNRPEGFTRAQLAQVAEMIAGDPENRWHDEAMDYARSDFYENTDMDEWLTETGLERMSDVEDQFDITWPHWDVPADEGEDIDVDSIGYDFSAAVGKKVNVSKSYHGGKREPNKYVVEPDGSLDPEDDDDVGLEFISPPLPLAEMMDQLKLVIAWAKNNNCYTNQSTGLHMNVSVPNFSRDRLDYVKLALLLGDEYILNSFGRMGNTYTKSALMKVRDRVASQPADAEQLLQAMKSHLGELASKAIHSGNTDKYTSINTKDNYIEFRSPGGDWLNEDIGKLESTITRFVVALDAAMDPEKHRKEYLSKLNKLLTAGKKDNTDIIQHFVKYSAGSMPKQALKSFIRQAQLERKIKKEPASGKRYWWRVRIGPAAIEVVATNKEEAWQKATIEYPEWARYSIRQAEITPLKPFEEEPKDQQRSGSQGPPPPELNGRPSNPDGNAYIATVRDPDTPLYRFMAASGDDARTVLDQWERQYGGNYVWRPDHLQLRGQPRQTQAAEPIGRVRAAGPSQPAWRAPDPRDGGYRNTWSQTDIENRLGWGSQEADANYEVVDRQTMTTVFKFIANTPTDAERKYSQFLDVMGFPQDTENYGFRQIPIPGSTLDLQRQRAAQSNNDNEGNVQWRILVGGEEVHRFWNRINQGEANTAARAWVMNQIRRGLLSPAEGADVEVVPVNT